MSVPVPSFPAACLHQLLTPIKRDTIIHLHLTPKKQINVRGRTRQDYERTRYHPSQYRKMHIYIFVERDDRSLGIDRARWFALPRPRTYRT